MLKSKPQAAASHTGQKVPAHPLASASPSIPSTQGLVPDAKEVPDLHLEVRPHFMTDSFDPHRPDYYWDFKITFTSYWHEALTVTKRSMKPLALGNDWRRATAHWDFWQPVVIGPGEILTISHLVKLHSDSAIIQGQLEFLGRGGRAFAKAIPPFSCDCPFSQRNYQ